MKILWVNTNFMHPTTKGGQIRTLEMLRHLHKRHEIHYVAIKGEAEGPSRAGEYSTRNYPVRHEIPAKGKPAFLLQIAKGFFNPVPLAVSRFHPPSLGPFLEDLIQRERFDRAVVDHLAPTAYFPRLERAVFFQHNVETVIWRRHVEHCSNPLRKMYFNKQAERMFEYERRVCQKAGHIVAVSDVDAGEMKRLFGVTRISAIPTGVNLDYFARTGAAASPAQPRDLVFLGSMDWLPNTDGVLYFVREILPIIRRTLPQARLAIVGRTPSPEITALKSDPLIEVTGTVPDIRPYLWNARVSIVPLRIGGGTRLKIYESMAAHTPVVSTTVGAEGLAIHPPTDIRIADAPEAFARECVALLQNSSERDAVAEAAVQMVSRDFSWDAVTRRFEEVLATGPTLC